MEQNNNERKRHFLDEREEMKGQGTRKKRNSPSSTKPSSGRGVDLSGIGSRQASNDKDKKQARRGNTDDNKKTATARGEKKPSADKRKVNADKPADKVEEQVNDGGENTQTAVQSRDDFAVEAKVRGGWFNSLFKNAEKDSVYSSSKIIHRSGIDIPLLMIFILLLAYGIIMVFSASYAYAYNESGNSYDFIRKQIIYAGTGIVIAILIVCFYDVFMNKKMIPYAVAIYYAIMFAMLILVLFIGRSDGEAKRWIFIGDVSIQPSEFMKGALIMIMALYYSIYNKPIKEGKGFSCFLLGTLLPMVVFILPVILLIYLENHASGMIIMFMIGIMMVVFGEKRHWFIGACAVIGVTVVTAAIIYLINLDPETATGIGKKIIESYQWKRIAIWLRPEDFSLRDDLWQTAQGMYAIGSGGFMGVGFGQSRQKHMFVSQPQNDFIYTIICEELGFVGAVAVIVLFCVLLWRGYVVGKRIPDRFSRYTVWGLTSSITLQAFLNIAVVTNLIPNTGISLPFFSYGGSSILSLMIEVGLILAISRYAKKNG